jgi:Flp pilus assembly CpaF family ATPase
VVTIEDAAELRLPLPHVVRLEARPPNLEGRGEVTIRRLVRNALRMRRIGSSSERCAAPRRSTCSAR